MADRYRAFRARAAAALAAVDSTLATEDAHRYEAPDALIYGKHATGDERDPVAVPLRARISGLLPGGSLA